jgi:hypothetical protein
MAEYKLFVLPEEPRINSAEMVEGRYTIPVDVGRISIIGFTDKPLAQPRTDVSLWPVPLLQLDGKPGISHAYAARYYGFQYNNYSKFFSSNITPRDHELKARFGHDNRGRAGEAFNQAFSDATRTPEGYMQLPFQERRRIAEELYDNAMRIHGGPTYHDLDAYLFPNGPVPYDQAAFEMGVITAIDAFALDIQLV